MTNTQGFEMRIAMQMVMNISRLWPTPYGLVCIKSQVLCLNVFQLMCLGHACCTVLFVYFGLLWGAVCSLTFPLSVNSLQWF